MAPRQRRGCGRGSGGMPAPSAPSYSASRAKKILAAAAVGALVVFLVIVFASMESAFCRGSTPQFQSPKHVIRQRGDVSVNGRSGRWSMGAPNKQMINAMRQQRPSVSNLKDQYFIIWVRSMKVKQWRPINIVSGAEMLKNMKKVGENDIAKAVGVGGFADFQMVKSIGMQLYQQKDDVMKSATNMHPDIKYAKETQFGFKEIANNTQFNSNPGLFMVPTNITAIPPEEELRNLIDDAGDAVKEAGTEIAKVGDNVKGFFGQLGR